MHVTPCSYVRLPSTLGTIGCNSCALTLYWCAGLATHSPALNTLHLDFHQRPDFGILALQRLLEGCPLLRSLSLGNRQLASLPPSLPPLIHLRVLCLNMPHLSCLPPSLPSLPTLHTLSLTHCEHMDTLGPSLCHFPQILRLELHSVGATIPGDLFHLTRLTSLVLHDAWLLPGISPHHFATLSSLTTLHIRQPCLPGCVRSVDFGGLRYLQEVILQDVEVDDLSPLLDPLSSLHGLAVVDCKLVTELPPALGRMTSLRSLHLHFPATSDRLRLTQLSSVLGGLTALENLSLSHCHLRCLPHLPFLRTLRLVEAVDGPTATAAALMELHSMEQLTELELQAEHLLHLPIQFSNLGLHTFRLVDSSFTSLPSNVGCMRSLRHLSICQGRLVDLPASFGELSELQSLRLQELSHLRTLPDSITDLPRLATLEIFNCCSLGRLPPTLAAMPALRTLTIHTCAIRTIGELPPLTSLSLVDCWALKSLPASLEGMSSLKHVVLHGLRSLERPPMRLHCLPGVRRLVVVECGPTPGRRRGWQNGSLRKLLTQLVDIVQVR